VSQVFWLNGHCWHIGKSTVAGTVAAFAEKQRILGASFSFSITDGRINPAVFFTTIAYQLVLVCKYENTSTQMNMIIFGRSQEVRF